jgi:uncharacterized surface protein with fasciclin (FAS1) repeats
MKAKVTRISLIAWAVSLALGSGLALAQEQQDPFADRESEQRSQEQRPDAVSESRSQDESRSQQQSDARPGQDHGDFESIAEQNPELSKFVEAIGAAGLADALTNGNDYTIFAPTNDAFDSENLDSLLEPDNREDLVAMLRAHIVADDVDRAMADTIGQAQTIDGGVVDISVDEKDKLMIGDAEATDEEIEIGNLRVYAVDAVLPSNPPAQTARNEAARQPGDAQR